MTSPTIIWWRSGRWSFEWPQRPSSAPPCPSKDRAKGYWRRLARRAVACHAYRPEPDDWTCPSRRVMRLAARGVPQHPKAGVRPVFDAARRASVEFCRTPGVLTRSDEQRASAASNFAQRPRQRRGATHRRRAPSMASRVDGGRPSATENRLDLPLERCPVFWARRSRSPGMLTLTCYPPRYPRILGIAGFYRPTNGPAAKYSPWCPAPRQPRQNRVNPGCTAAWDIRVGLVSHEALT
jgi:hypothetical protein